MVSDRQKGTLEVICGSMFSGKSEELIRRLRRAQFARLNVLVFKHSLDERTHIDYVASHNGNKIKAIPIDNPSTINTMVTAETQVIGIDEIQFFSHDIINIVCSLVEAGKRVIVAGLDLDFRCVPFGPLPLLLAVADHVTKLKAICSLCGNEAHFTQRLVNEQPARASDPIVLVGAEECYQARCRDCHMIDRIPTF